MNQWIKEHGNGTANKSIHYVLVILLGLLRDSFIMNMWKKEEIMF